MTLDLWHYEFDLRSNEITSQRRRRFHPAEKDAIFNDAILIWVEQQYSGNNHKKTAAETTQQRWDNLSSLVVKFPEQGAILPEPSLDGVYEFDLKSQLTYDYLHALRIQGVIECGSGTTARSGGTTPPVPPVPPIPPGPAYTGDVKTLVKTVQHDDLDRYMNDPFKKPSSGPFPRLIGNFGKSSITPGGTSYFIYTDGTFEVSRLYMEYLKRPAVVSLGGYNDIEGNPVSRVESDIPENFHSQIIDIAVDELERILGDSNRFQLQSQKQNINE